MRSFVLSLVISLCFAISAFAQSTPLDTLTPPLPTHNERLAADIASYVPVVINLTLDTKASWDAPDRKLAFEKEAVRLGVTIGVSEAVKLLVHRERPCYPSCGIDSPTSSFYSMHTALAFSALGGPRFEIAFPLAITAGGLRVAAGKHYLTDVLVGAAAGTAASFIR